VCLPPGDIRRSAPPEQMAGGYVAVHIPSVSPVDTQNKHVVSDQTCRRPRNKHQFIGHQIVHLEEAVEQARTLLKIVEEGSFASSQESTAKELTSNTLDDSCLNLCISLLDYTLKESLSKSVAVSFLTLLEIDVA
jgi:hypothetical protein